MLTRVTSAPIATIAFWSFSASSLVQFSFNVFGSDSTNFFACSHT